MLISTLPADSATVRALNDGTPPWETEHYMIADLYDAVMHNAWLVANRGAEAKDQGPRPEPYPRPGGKPAEDKQKVSAADLEAFKRRTYGKG